MVCIRQEGRVWFALGWREGCGLHQGRKDGRNGGLYVILPFFYIGAATDRSNFASDASHTWNTFLRSTGGVVSGEGLIGSSGLTPEAARQEVSKMDQENARWLSQFPEQEILEQQEKIKNTLGTIELCICLGDKGR